MKGMKSRYVALPTIVAAPAILLFACRGEGLDVGSTQLLDAPPRADAQPLADHEPLVDRASEPESPELPPGFVIDGVPCPSVVASGGDADGWPAWRISLNGPCASFGQITGFVNARADLAYPQRCSVATTLAFTIPPESDAGLLDFGADAVRGSCVLTSGPSSSNPSAPLVFEATLVFQFDASRTHHVTYRGTPSSPIDSGGGETGGPGNICNLQPTGPSRPSAVACSAGGAADACLQDSDCPTGPCGCGGASDHHNVCYSNSDCRIDADCPSGQRCVLSHPFVLGYPSELGGTPIEDGSESDPNGELLGYFCTTPQDTCCTQDAGPGPGTCVYRSREKHWVWGYAL